jgi:hypothetical protein
MVDEGLVASLAPPGGNSGRAACAFRPHRQSDSGQRYRP